MVITHFTLTVSINYKEITVGIYHQIKMVLKHRGPQFCGALIFPPSESSLLPGQQNNDARPATSARADLNTLLFTHDAGSTAERAGLARVNPPACRSLSSQGVVGATLFVRRGGSSDEGVKQRDE
jgi:hypothetical protein